MSLRLHRTPRRSGKVADNKLPAGRAVTTNSPNLFAFRRLVPAHFFTDDLSQRFGDVGLLNR
jgi:hypothetical protein